jgi:hypothetical protein
MRALLSLFVRCCLVLLAVGRVALVTGLVYLAVSYVGVSGHVGWFIWK